MCVICLTNGKKCVVCHTVIVTRAFYIIVVILLFKPSGKKCSRPTILMFVLLMIILALVIVIGVTYGMKLQCDDNDDKNAMHKKRKSSSTSFFLISDIHLDLFYKEGAPAGKMSFCRNESMSSTYNAPYGRVGCDSPLNLLNQVLDAMKKQENNVSVDFIMLSG